jgi:hypothetical protein
MVRCPPPESSYEELAAHVVELVARLEQANVGLERAQARIVELETEVVELRARLGRDSTNSSTPPSADSLAAKGNGRLPGRSGCGRPTAGGVGSRDGLGRA